MPAFAEMRPMLAPADQSFSCLGVSRWQHARHMRPKRQKPIALRRAESHRSLRAVLDAKEPLSKYRRSPEFFGAVSIGRQNRWIPNLARRRSNPDSADETPSRKRRPTRLLHCHPSLAPTLWILRGPQVRAHEDIDLRSNKSLCSSNPLPQLPPRSRTRKCAHFSFAFGQVRQKRSESRSRRG